MLPLRFSPCIFTWTHRAYRSRTHPTRIACLFNTLFIVADCKLFAVLFFHSYFFFKFVCLLFFFLFFICVAFYSCHFVVHVCVCVFISFGWKHVFILPTTYFHLWHSYAFVTHSYNLVLQIEYFCSIKSVWLNACQSKTDFICGCFVLTSLRISSDAQNCARKYSDWMMVIYWK